MIKVYGFLCGGIIKTKVLRVIIGSDLIRADTVAGIDKVLIASAKTEAKASVGVTALSRRHYWATVAEILKC